VTAAHLTDAEIAEQTFPLTQGAARIRYYKALGCKVKARPNGQPLVARADFDAVMLGQRLAKPRAPTPDYAALAAFQARP